jgi:hypothetical protein
MAVSAFWKEHVMEKNHLAKLETHIRSLKSAHAAFGNTDDWEEMQILIHRPGWTSPAEQLFVVAALESILEQTKQLNTLREGLLAGARAVGANPARAAGV